MADPGCHGGNLNAGPIAHLGGRLAPFRAASSPATPPGSAHYATPDRAGSHWPAVIRFCQEFRPSSGVQAPVQEFRKARTASTRRLSSVDGARSSLAKMLVLCLPTA